MKGIILAGISDPYVIPGSSELGIDMIRMSLM